MTGSSLFMSRNLFSCGYDASDFQTASTWTLFIDDYSSTGGQLQYFKIQVDGKTNPTNADSDGDGILDGEEVNMGADGWVTNPVLTDTDSDGLSDRLEAMGTIAGVGSTPCGQKLDPTYADTDGDGFSDGIDPYLGDMVLHLRFDEFKALEDINWGPSHNIFFYVYYGDMRLATARFNAVTNTIVFPELDYYLNIWETNSSQSFSIQCVADEAGTLGDDIQLDGVSGGARDYAFTYTFSSSSYSTSTQGSNDFLDGDADVYYHFLVEKKTNPTRARTIIINSTDESSGLFVASDGSYRYCADEQVYLLYITVPSSSLHFANGVNVIIVPRFIALESRLNDTLTTNPGSTELAGGSFYTTDTTVASASGHVIAVIEKSMSCTDAENLLTRLTHNSTNARIANNVTVTTSQLYLLHLPSDISSRIPYTLNSDAFGEAPDYLSWSGVIGFVNNILMSFGYALLNLAVNLFIGGITLMCGLLTGNVSMVLSAVNKIVDAFAAFVQWAIEFICDAFNALIVQPLQALYNNIVSWAMGLISRINAAAESIEDGMDNSSASYPIFKYIVDSDIFKLLFVIGAALLTVITISTFLGPFSFISLLVVPFIVDLIISGMVSAVLIVMQVTDAAVWIAETIWDILGDGRFGGMAGIMGATIGTISWLASLMSLTPYISAITGFALTSLGAILAWAGTIITDQFTNLVFDIAGLALSCIGIYQIFFSKDPSLLDMSKTAKSILKAVSSIELGISALELTTTVASYD